MIWPRNDLNLHCFFSIMVQVIQDIMTAKLNIGMHVENAKTRNRNK